jgi:hypothetical protein
MTNAPVHLLSVMWEAVIPRIVTEAGLLPPDFVSSENHEEPIKG